MTTSEEGEGEEKGPCEHNLATQQQEQEDREGPLDRSAHSLKGQKTTTCVCVRESLGRRGRASRVLHTALLLPHAPRPPLSCLLLLLDTCHVAACGFCASLALQPRRRRQTAYPKPRTSSTRSPLLPHARHAPTSYLHVSHGPPTADLSSAQVLPRPLTTTTAARTTPPPAPSIALSLPTICHLLAPPPRPPSLIFKPCLPAQPTAAPRRS